MKFPLNRPRDTVPAMLRPGEGVLVPEATAEMGGRQGINAMNRGAEARRRMLARGKKPVQHFAFGGVTAPVLQGGPSFDPRMPQRGMPPAPAFRAPAPVQSPYPVGVGGGTEPGPFTMPPPVLRQPMAMPPNVDPRIQHFRQGGVAVAGGGPNSGGTGWNGQAIGGIDFPEADMRDPFGGPHWADQGFDPGMSHYSNWGYIGQGPGALQGRTLNPSFFDSMGYPYAQLATGEASIGQRNESIHTPPRHNQ